MSGDFSGFESDISNHFEPQRSEHEKKGLKLGVSSGHLYFAIPRLWEIYGPKTRFILLVRRPDEFVRSAMARGFFDPEHPHYCNQLHPASDDPITSTWKYISVLERNLWYWSLVNRFVLNTFDKLPGEFWRIFRIEELCADLVLEICTFLGIDDISVEFIDDLLYRRINSSPGQQGILEPNPYSLPITMPAFSDWDNHQRTLLDNYTSDIVSRLYS